MGSVLYTDAAKHYNANPAASFQLERLYGCPVLLSGLAALVLSIKEIGIILRHHLVSLYRLHKLPSNTPDCVVFFPVGSLPDSALMHLRQLAWHAVQARPESILQQVGREVLLSDYKGKSRFLQFRTIHHPLMQGTSHILVK